jgi:hypothetical protein
MAGGIGWRKNKEAQEVTAGTAGMLGDLKCTFSLGKHSYAPSATT